MTIKELNQTIEDMRKVHNFTDDALMRVSRDNQNRVPLVTINICEADVAITLEKVVYEETRDPYTGM